MHGLNITENGEVPVQTPPYKAASELGLHHFLWCFDSTLVVKDFKNSLFLRIL